MKQRVAEVGSRVIGGQMKHIVAGVGHCGVEIAAASTCGASDVANEVTTSSSGFSLMGASGDRGTRLPPPRQYALISVKYKYLTATFYRIRGKNESHAESAE